MRDNMNLNQLTSLKEQFSNALEKKEFEDADKILNQIDDIYLKASGKTFRSTLTKESQEKLENFLKNNGEVK